jgi:hypothetical protein
LRTAGIDRATFTATAWARYREALGRVASSGDQPDDATADGDDAPVSVDVVNAAVETGMNRDRRLLTHRILTGGTDNR